MKSQIFKAKNIGVAMLMAFFALVITSCSKENLSPMGNDTNVAASTTDLRKAPIVPEIIQVPEGNKLVWSAYATGSQIYQCERSTTDSTVFLWVFIAPDATLYSDQAYTEQVGIHYVGPTWEATTGPKEGKKVVGLKLQSITEDITAVPWLLLSAVPSSEPDSYTQITYIQRLYTTGGLAPTTGADAAHEGEQVNVPYTAQYFFYAAR
ncbi:MAG: DUF3455 domain-containing protein [Chitinophagales bacterium]|nr:DUF3455 domain-containing protein [Chitinophagales bacterium]